MSLLSIFTFWASFMADVAVLFEFLGIAIVIMFLIMIALVILAGFFMGIVWLFDWIF